jgi:hypothetical protein
MFTPPRNLIPPLVHPEVCVYHPSLICTGLMRLTIVCYYWLIDWLIDWLFTGVFSRWRIFHLYGDATIAGEGLQNLGLCSAFMAFEQGGIFIVPHLLWHGTSVYPVSSENKLYCTNGVVLKGTRLLYINGSESLQTNGVINCLQSWLFETFHYKLG